MVGDDAHGYVALLVAAVLLAGHGRYAAYRRLEDVGVVVRLLALQYHAETLEAHARIDVLRGQRFERAVGLAVELHEYQIPDLYDQTVSRVDHVAAGDGGDVGLVAQVEMYLAARAAGTRLAHFPEIVVLVTANDMILRQISAPVVVGLLIERHAVGIAALEHGGVHALLGQMINLRQQLPSPLYGLLFEVVAVRPVAEHLEHRMMIRIVSDLLEVVVLARNAQTLLRIGHTGIFARGIAQKYILELIHAGIGKHQRRVVLDDHRRRRHDDMFLAFEKFEESPSDLIRVHILGI